MSKERWHDCYIDSQRLNGRTYQVLTYLFYAKNKLHLAACANHGSYFQQGPQNKDVWN